LNENNKAETDQDEYNKAIMIKQLIEENELDIKSIKHQIKLKVQFHSQLPKG